MVVPDDAVVYAPTVAAWLLAQPVAGRIACRPQTTVAAIEATGVLLADGSRIAAGAILLANGLQAPELLPSLPIQAKKRAPADYRSLSRHHSPPDTGARLYKERPHSKPHAGHLQCATT